MLAISKTVYLTLLTLTLNSLIEELQKTQKTFIWHSSGPKIGNLENCGLKHVDTPLKIVSLQCSWLQKLHDESFREWKAIPSHFTFKLIHASVLVVNDIKSWVLQKHFVSVE